MKKKILIADDEHIVLKDLKSILAEKGFEVFTALDGIHALQLGTKINPDLVVLDINMPGVTGDVVYENLRMVHRTKIIPVIFISALSFENVADRIKSIDREDFFQKPLVLKNLVEKIQKILTNEPTLK